MNVVMAGKRVVFENRAKAFDLPSHDHRQEKLRLVAPFCMVLLLITNVLLVPRGLLYQCMFVAQLLAYALPAIGVLWPFARRWRIVKLGTAFLMLNWFAVLGLVEFLRNRNAHLWESKQRPPTGFTGLR